MFIEARLKTSLWKRLHEYWVYHPIWDYKLQADESTI
jgi:hypothetical protein